jgi:hypothetical protein
MTTRALQILWPAFLFAGVLEMLVFALVDPADLHVFGGAVIDWSTQAIHTVAFLLFWGAMATSGAVTMLLAVEAEPDARSEN